jgi:methyl-accepting chemotaxis protein
MQKKNYRRREVFDDLRFNLRQRFNIKCIIDILVFIVILTMFIVYALKHGDNSYETILYLGIISLLYITSHFITKQWILSSIRKTLSIQSNTVSETATEFSETISNQRKIVESLTMNTKNFTNLIEKLKLLSGDALVTSKNTEKQLNQSISFSQKEHEAISTNSEKMLILRQKIQMIAELILELSEHTQQIGNTISVVDDIAEQTNMLALNAAVEAARAGEHGKGFAVVAGEIRKLADESKQAITKITALTSNIQYTTNSTVMATEEGSKEIESVVKDINSVSSNSEILLNLIGNVLESIVSLNQNAEKQSSIIEKLNLLDEENKIMSDNLAQIINTNNEKLAKLNSLSNEIKNSAIEG